MWVLYIGRARRRFKVVGKWLEVETGRADAVNALRFWNGCDDTQPNKSFLLVTRRRSVNRPFSWPPGSTEIPSAIHSLDYSLFGLRRFLSLRGLHGMFPIYFVSTTTYQNFNLIHISLFSHLSRTHGQSGRLRRTTQGISRCSARSLRCCHCR